jgi:hypothetical protein
VIRCLSWSWQQIFLLFKASRPDLGPIRPRTQRVPRPRTQRVPGHLEPGVKWAGREAKHSPPHRAEVKQAWCNTSAPPSAFIASTGTTHLLTNRVLQKITTWSGPRSNCVRIRPTSTFIWIYPATFNHTAWCAYTNKNIRNYTFFQKFRYAFEVFCSWHWWQEPQQHAHTHDLISGKQTSLPDGV